MGGVECEILPSNSAEQLIDFTCASSWERLALDIELEFRAWGIHDGKAPANEIPASPRHSSSPITATESISPTPIVCSRLSLDDVNLSLELRSAPPSELFAPHPVGRLFGVAQYVLLTSATANGIAADDAPKAAILLSALSVAASSCRCALPMFVPIGRPSFMRFMGRQLYPNHKRFSCDYTHQLSEKYMSVSGLLFLYRNKLASARPLFNVDDCNERIAARFSYEWTDFSFKLTPTPGTFTSDRSLNAVQSRPLAEADPVRLIRISAVWNDFSANELEDHDVLPAMPAATCSWLRLFPTPKLMSEISAISFPSSRIPMAACARQNLRLAQLAASKSGQENPAAPVPLIDLEKIIQAQTPRTSSGSARYSVHGSPRAATASPSALEEYLFQVGKYAEATSHRDETIDEEFLTSAIAALFEMDIGRGIMVDVVDALGSNAAEMGVLERVARLMAVSESLIAAQRLWNLFLDGVQVHWEQLWVVGGVAFGIDAGPDHDASLILQKIQMINCCVERLRQQRNRRNIASVTGLSGQTMQRTGRKNPLIGVSLIGKASEQANYDVSDTRVWEPYVQPHPLTTRDMVEEELQRMVLRAEANGKSDDKETKRQSMTLKSDMMAFKAANPSGTLADFIRWFSPSDWIVEDDVPERPVGTSRLNTTNSANAERPENGQTIEQKSSGKLSARMSREGNIWEQLWKEAEGVPAHLQVPLFDAAGHGNKALADLRAMPLSQVFIHMAIIQSDCACTLLQRAFARPPELPNVRSLVEHARHMVRNVSAKIGLTVQDTGEIRMVSEIVENIALAEHAALVATSALTKLPPADSMGIVADRMAVGQFADIKTETEKQLVTRMAGLDDGGWRSMLLPQDREFLIEGKDGDRMYARWRENDFRVGLSLSLEI